MFPYIIFFLANFSLCFTEGKKCLCAVRGALFLTPMYHNQCSHLHCLSQWSVAQMKSWPVRLLGPCSTKLATNLKKKNQATKHQHKPTKIWNLSLCPKLTWSWLHIRWSSGYFPHILSHVLRDATMEMTNLYTKQKGGKKNSSSDILWYSVDQWIQHSSSLVRWLWCQQHWCHVKDQVWWDYVFC